jgi:RNA polymerase sigma-70 factor (ECF subfamily)
MDGQMSVSEVMSELDRESLGQLAKEEHVSHDAMLVESLRADDPDASAALFDAYGQYVERLLVRVLGRDPEIEDLLHEVFVEALANIGQLRDPAKLKGWLTRMTVFIARGSLRRRRRQAWLVFLPGDEVPEQPSGSSAPETRDLLARVFAVLRKLRPNHRIAFSLRYIEGMTLPEAAEASGVSLATFKRWLKASDHAFLARAKRTDHALYQELLESPRWGAP